MPASERPEGPGSGEAEGGLAVLDRLEATVARLIEEVRTLRERAEQSESAHEKLRRALETAERRSGSSEDLEERLERLADENRRLREMLEGARERAERIRSRLMVVEDEL